MSSKAINLECKPTRWGEAVIASALTRKPINYIDNSTYNELCNILPLDHKGTSEIPFIGFAGIGIGSEHMVSLTHPTNGKVIETPQSYRHYNRDGVPFIPIPYNLRKEGEDDLPESEREKYAIRSIIELDGVRYVARWLRRFEESDDKVETDLVELDASGNITNIGPLPPSADVLNPKRDITFVGESPSSNNTVNVRSSLRIELTSLEIDELINVANIMFGTGDLEITEFSMVAGIEKPHSVTDGEKIINYTEVIGAQSTHFSPLNFKASQRVGVGVDINFMIGQSLPEL